MPTMPTAESLGARPIPEPNTGIARYQPTSGRETAPGEAMAALGTTIDQAGGQVEQEMKRIATIQAEDAWNKLKEKELDLTYGPENGYMHLRGANAINKPLVTDYSTRFSSEVAQLLDTLPSDEAKRLFTQRAAVSSINLKDGILRHQAQQADAFAKQTFEGAKAVELQSTAANWGDPNAIAASQTRIEALIDAEARRTGLAPDLVKAEKDQFKSQQYTTVINQALAVGNYPFAKLVYENNKALLNPAIAKSFQPYEAKTIADEAMKNVLQDKVVLTGLGLEDGKMGLRGDPQVLAEQINLFVNAADREEALAQMRRQAQAPGGTAVQAPGRLDLLARLGEMFQKAAALTQKKYPNDPVMLDMVNTQLKGYVSNYAQAQAGIAKKAADTLVGIAIGPNQPTTFPELLQPPGALEAWDKLDMESRKGLMGLLEHNARAARGEFTRSSPQVLADLYARIQLPEGDPNRISSSAQLLPWYGKGLSPTDGDRMGREIQLYQTPEGNPFLREKQSIRTSAHNMFTRSMVGQIQPEVAEEAWVRWGQTLDAKIDAYRKEGKDPRMLWQATDGAGKPNPDYVLAPGYVASFMPGPRAAVGAEAKAATPAGAAAPQFEKDKVYEFKQGKMKYLGGDPKKPTSWEPAK